MTVRGDVDALLDEDGITQATAIADGDVSVDELVAAVLERIATRDGALGAVIDVFADRARSKARHERSGPLAGVPMLVKDLLLEIEGTHLSEGSRLLDGYVSTHTQELARRYEDRAGMLIVGKTNVPEFGMAATTEPDLHGPTRNPWDGRRTAGGSSGGSAAAVAAGFVAVAHGNDLLGSLRTPAACCGVVALKPTRGRVPLGPAYGDFGLGFAAEQVLTRSVRDNALVLDCVAGAAPGDPYSAPPLTRPLVEVAADGTHGRIEPLRVALWSQPPTGGSIHPQVRQGVDDVGAACATLGHHVVEAAPDVFDARWSEAIMLVAGSAVACGIAEWERRLERDAMPLLEPATAVVYQLVSAISARDLLLAQVDLQRRCRTAGAFFEDHDVWITPVIAEPPPLLGALKATADDPLLTSRAGGDFAPFTSFANATGGPALALPLTWSDDGLPLGVQLHAAPGREDLVVALGAQLEAAMPWSSRRPLLPEAP